MDKILKWINIIHLISILAIQITHSYTNVSLMPSCRKQKKNDPGALAGQCRGQALVRPCEVRLLRCDHRLAADGGRFRPETVAVSLFRRRVRDETCGSLIGFWMILNYVDGIHAGFLLILMESKHQRMEI